MANVFISHRDLDQVPAERLARDLRRAGHEVAFEPWTKELGDAVVGHLSSGLQGVCYLLLCYAHGLEPWVTPSWQASLIRQLEYHGIRFLPLWLAGAEPPPLLADLRHEDMVTDWDEGLSGLLWKIR